MGGLLTPETETHLTAKPVPMTRWKKRVLTLLLVGVALIVASPFVLNIVLDHLIYEHRFPSEMRVVAPDGSITFRPYALHPEDKGHLVQSAFLARGLWPTHHISTEDNDYLFGPFGRVVVLKTVGIHSRGVTSTRHWAGESHAFPFSDTPMTERDFLQFYTAESRHDTQ